ncbi:MAG: GtrA family protein [Alistipes sp.]|nr:GtrA family protein [Alistipes sp.]
MALSQALTKLIDRFYVNPVSKFCSREFFRYGVCGAANMILDALWYFAIYHFLIKARYIDLGIVTISPHISSLAIVFPITFFTGFLLNRHVAFHATQQQSGKQLKRYALSVLGSIVINYVCMKLFVEYFNIWPTPSKLLTTIVTVAYSFLAVKYFTFRNQNNK